MRNYWNQRRNGAAKGKGNRGQGKEPPEKITLKGLTDVFTYLNKFLRKFEHKDPNVERFLIELFRVYYWLARKCVMIKKKQNKKKNKLTTMEISVKRMTTHQEELQVGPSGDYSRRRQCHHGRQELQASYWSARPCSDIDDPYLVSAHGKLSVCVLVFNKKCLRVTKIKILNRKAYTRKIQ